MNFEEYTEKIDLLTQENEKLKKHISSLHELLSTDICKFFQISNSIKQTKKRFCYETIRECYGDLVYFYGSNDTIQYAEDYKECFKDIFGREYPDDDADDESNYESIDETIDESNYEENDEQYMFGSSFENIFNLICKDLIENNDINVVDI
jgi:hypothetical protein